MFDIAIVGLGATGISLLKQIQEQVYAYGITPPRIALFSPRAEFALGQAFGDADPIHKVNTPPNMLSVAESEPFGFAHWMAETYGADELFPSRLTFSKFLNDTYQSITRSQMLVTEEIHEAVSAISRKSNCYELETKSHSIKAEKVVLCLGSLHGNNFPALAGMPGFCTRRQEFSTIGNGPVLVAGTGLTAIDFFRSLNQNHNREIHLFSRHGLAPTCLSKANRYVPKTLTWKNLLQKKNESFRLRNFLGMLKTECQLLPDGGERAVAMRLWHENGLTDYFSYLMTRAQEGNLPYQDILVSTRPYMHHLWRAIPIEDRIAFHINDEAAWATWRHPVPYEVIGELASAARDGRLHIHQVTAKPQWENGVFSVKNTAGKTIKASNFVNGTGGTNRLDAIDSPLIKSLLRHQLIEPDPCGGMSVHPLTFQCQVRGSSVPNLYNLGPLNKGALFSTNAFWFNARCAGHWARQWAIEASQDISIEV